MTGQGGWKASRQVKGGGHVKWRRFDHSDQLDLCLPTIGLGTETRCSVGLARGAHVGKWTVIRWCTPPYDNEKNHSPNHGIISAGGPRTTLRTT